MTYAEGRVIHDADSHVMETREWLDPYMDEDLKTKLRPLYGRTPGRIDKLLAQAKARKGDREAEAKAFDNPIAGPKGWIAAGAFDPQERSRVLDQFGFSSQLVFGTSSLAPALAAKDQGALYAGVRAHNEAMAAFCRPDKRLLGVAFAASLKQQGITEISIPAASLIGFLILSALLGLGAASWPARRAAKLDVLAAIAAE